IDALKADIGVTLAFGILIAIPTVILAGPVFAQFISRYVVVEVPTTLLPARERELATARAGGGGSRLDDDGLADDRDVVPAAPDAGRDLETGETDDGGPRRTP